MKTIKQQEEIAFHAPNFKDAIVLLPLMDALTKSVNYNRVADFYDNLPKEEKDKYRKVWHQGGLDIPAESMEAILKILQTLGFESQIDLKEAGVNDLRTTEKS
jgi:hypothetical protein